MFCKPWQTEKRKTDKIPCDILLCWSAIYVYIMEDLFDSVQDQSFAPLVIKSSAILINIIIVGIVRVFVDAISISSNFDLKVSFVPNSSVWHTPLYGSSSKVSARLDWNVCDEKKSKETGIVIGTTYQTQITFDLISDWIENCIGVRQKVIQRRWVSVLRF